MLQSHYRSTLDISDTALQAAEKALQRLLESYNNLASITPHSNSSIQEEIIQIKKECENAMNDDLNTAVMLSHLFELSKIINSAFDGKISLTGEDLSVAKQIYDDYLFHVSGIKSNSEENTKVFEVLNKVVEIVLELRKEAKQQKNYSLSDRLRDKLLEAGIHIKDLKEGTTWKLA
jgi:cysteinyl-tRNA synthetase